MVGWSFCYFVQMMEKQYVAFMYIKVFPSLHGNVTSGW